MLYVVEQKKGISKALFMAGLLSLSVVGIGTAIASKIELPINSTSSTEEFKPISADTVGAVCKDFINTKMCFKSAIDFQRQITTEQYNEISSFQSQLKSDVYDNKILEALKDKYISIDEYIELKNTYFLLNQEMNKEDMELKEKINQTTKELLELSEESKSMDLISAS